MTDRVYAFGYYGGKLSHLKQLLPLLPKCQTYVEPFGGSGAVLLNRAPSPVEVYNDLDGEIVNFFRVLRERPNELIRAIALTPYSRAEFRNAIQQNACDELERARQFYVRVGQSRANSPAPLASHWSYSITDTKRDMSSAVSGWHSIVARLESVAQRLLSVQLECLPALDVISRYDTPNTLFYIDPPYVHATRQTGANYAYVHELSDEQHRQLAEALQSTAANVAVSGYDGDLYRSLFDGWYVTTWAARAAATPGSVKGSRTEVLWTNYDPAVMDDLPLFARLV